MNTGPADSSLLSLSLPKLIIEDKIYVGFVGGLQKLKNTSIDDLLKRDHYKVSFTRWNANWIQLDLILGHYFNQKFNNQTEESELL